MDDDIPQLPADTLRLLQEFNDNEEARAKDFEELKSQAERNFPSGKLSMSPFGEDWNVSQFWYNDRTAQILAKSLAEGAEGDTWIAVVSAPSAYVALRNLVADRPVSARPTIRLFECDRRFEVFGQDFIFYDFEQPFQVPAGLESRFDRITCDPPFLSEDCQTKTALTVRYLARDWEQPQRDSRGLRLVCCTGERMTSVIHKAYGMIGTRMTTFEPQHSSGLSNEFRCYANFECDDWRWC